MDRLKFKPGEQTKYINNVLKISGLSLSELAQIARVVPRSFRDWRMEKLHMTTTAAGEFNSRFKVKLPENRNILINRWQEHKKTNNRLGGIARVVKHGNPGTTEGRSKGGIKGIATLRAKGLLIPVKSFQTPGEFTNELAEFVGIMLGDGGMTYYQCTVTLNGEADKEYIKFVLNLMQSLFRHKPKLVKRKDSKAVVIYFYGIRLIQYLTKIGLKTGNKVRQQVSVPKWISESNNHRMHCLRGLMDTDGGIFPHRYVSNGKKYKYYKLCFKNQSKPLIDFVYNSLEQLGFTPKISLTSQTMGVWLYSQTEVKKYYKLIGSDNPRLLRYNIAD